MVIFSFYSGVGMLDLGFQEAGFDIVFVNEYKKEFLDSYQYARRNRYPNPPRFGYHVGDINQFLSGIEEQTLRQYIMTLRQEGELIAFIGGPPCPDFSVGGKNLGRDGENGRLAKSYVDMICRFKPDFFLFENVKGLIKTQRHREYFDELKLQLQNNGYVLSEQLLNSLSFGVPQDRDRIIMMGVGNISLLSHRVICVNNSFAFPWKSSLPYDAELVKTMNWPNTQRFAQYSRREFHYNVPIELTVEYWFRKNNVYHHSNRNDVFNVRGGLQKMQRICEGDTSRKSFKRLHRWRYSPTAAYGNNEVHLHPYRIRRISVAEAMAIQSLPIWFELPPNVSLSAKFKMIGNGVPYLMANIVAQKIRDFF
ncbi:DNA cytosine methyltransferase [Aminipila terrae]|uniref:DNA (cytosine-5-)-methyltransferase n=1 Tax=Aminipila terrae TaxID=2697030 RepID=A0A6P1MAQ7_9FIRM|nr:DNA cytosine methyltransferase [Aminipila terrae]QHI71122.1 DNA (cytosine-5-)-methyltransferase [Aminipila terrae]